jgi:hypothetical protein
MLISKSLPQERIDITYQTLDTPSVSFRRLKKVLWCFSPDVCKSWL